VCINMYIYVYIYIDIHIYIYILNNQSSRSHAVVTLEVSYSNNTTVPKSSRKSNLLSPTVSFTHSMKTGTLFSPEKLHLNEEPKSTTTPHKDGKEVYICMYIYI
jgi:hypothetical protein